mgnify:CR=1 FL=1
MMGRILSNVGRGVGAAIVALATAGFLGFAAASSAIAADDGFEPIFDGKTLKNWDGNPKFWSVKDGAITGKTSKDNPTQGNTFIIWTGGETGDFELKLQYKIIGGNSGIQYRSFRLPGKNDGWRIGGYQADFEAGNTYSGILYGERFRGILCNRGLKTQLIREGGKFQVKTIKRLGDSKAIQAKIKKEDWNDYHITARGFHLVHRINGVVTADCTDNDAKQRRATGLLALQLHAGPPMKVQFRNIRLKSLGKKTAVSRFFNPTLPTLPTVNSLSDLPSPNAVANRVAEETGGVATEAIRAFLGLPADVRDAVVETPLKRKLPATTEGGGLIRTVRSKRAQGLRFLATPLRNVIRAVQEPAVQPKKKGSR